MGSAAAAAALASLQVVHPADASLLTDLSSTPIAETRQGIYKEYEVENDWKTQKYDNADGTFATKEKTEEGRNKYVGVLAVLLIGSFIIPMAQYFWYVRE